MREYSTDLIERMIDDIARLSVELVTMRLMGLEDEALTRLVALDEQANKLDESLRARIGPALARLHEAWDEGESSVSPRE